MPEDVLWTLYPNPASGVVFLEGLENQAEVTISDMMGRVVSSFTAHGTREAVDVSALSAGTYFVRIGGCVQKLIVK